MRIETVKYEKHKELLRLILLIYPLVISVAIFHTLKFSHNMTSVYIMSVHPELIQVGDFPFDNRALPYISLIISGTFLYFASFFYVKKNPIKA